MQLLTFTLGASAYIKGIVTVRGAVVPIYSLASRFGYLEDKLEYFMILNVGGMRFGIEVDMVNAVIDTERMAPLFLLPGNKKRKTDKQWFL